LEFTKQEQLDKHIAENPLTRFGVTRPHIVFVMITVICVLGFFAFSSMNAALFPNMNIPYIVVIARHDDTLPDVNSDPLETLDNVTNHIEATLLQVSGVNTLQTMTMQGMVITFIEFDANVDMSGAEFQVTMAMIRLGNVFAANNFEQIPIVLALDPSMMPALVFSTDFVIYKAGGETVDEKATIDWYNNVFAPKLRTVSGVAEVNGAILSTPRPADFDDMGGFAYVNNHPSFSFSIQQASSAVTTELVPKIFTAINEVRASVKADYDQTFAVNVQLDQAELINDSVGSVLNNLLLGGLFAIIILFLFLRSWKLTLAVGLSIPLSVVGTFVLMFFLGVTLNMVSLVGLALAVGMLVDNSIIVVENTFRLRAKGMSIRDAAIKGASQIFGAILAATLTTIAVFIPMFFVTGLIMQMFMELVYVIIFALFASLVSAAIFLPSIITTLKVEYKAPKTSEEKQVARKEAKAAGGFGAVVSSCGSAFDVVKTKTDKWYNGALRFTMKQKWVTLGVALVLLVGSVFLAYTNGFEMMPSEETGSFSVNISVNPQYGTIFGDAALASKARTLAKHDDENEEDLYKLVHRVLPGDVDSVTISHGSGGFLGGLGGGGLTVDVSLKNKRSMSTSKASQLVFNAVSEFLGDDLQKPEDTMMVAMMKFASDVSISSGSGMNIMSSDSIVVTLAAPITDDIEEALEALERAITLVHEKLFEKRQALGIHKVSNDLLLFRDPVTSDLIVGSISRDNRRITASVTATIRDGQNIGKVQSRVDNEMAKLRKDNKDAFTGITDVEDGFAAQFSDTFRQMGMAIMVGLLLMYLVMVGIFRSFKSPFIMLMTIPLGFTGGFLFLWMFGMPISLVAMIGLMLLMGVIVNNGIVLVDYINQSREEGLNVKEAVIAAANSRVRPILMLALSTIGAMLPMALGFGMNGGMMQPMAVVTIGGLIYATAMSLLVIPAFYCIFNRDKKQKPALATVEGTLQENSEA